MKNENIARILRYYRKINRLSVKNVAEIFDESNNRVAIKTIYAWESGRTQPDADTLLFLCKLYKIENILETFGYSNNSKEPIYLTEFEDKLIRAYRNHPELHMAIDKLLEL